MTWNGARPPEGWVERCCRHRDGLEAGLEEEAWIQDFADAVRGGFPDHRVESFNHEPGGGRTTVLWKGGRPVGVSVTVRDDMNHAMVLMFNCDFEKLPKGPPEIGEAGPLGEDPHVHERSPRGAPRQPEPF